MIEAAWSLSDDTASPVMSADSSGSAHLLPDLVLNQAFAGDDFARAVASATDGQPGQLMPELISERPGSPPTDEGTVDAALIGVAAALAVGMRLALALA